MGLIVDRTQFKTELVNSKTSQQKISKWNHRFLKKNRKNRIKQKQHVRYHQSPIYVTGVPEKETEDGREVTSENFPKLLKDINPCRLKKQSKLQARKLHLGN